MSGNKFYEELLELAESDTTSVKTLSCAYAFLLGRLEAFAEFVNSSEFRGIDKYLTAKMLGFEIRADEGAE